MDGTGDHRVKQDKPSSKSQMSCFHLNKYSRSLMIIILILVMRQEHKRTVSREESVRGRREKEESREGMSRTEIC
jgi:hypothetical protein